MNIKNSSPQNEQILEDRFQMLLSINFSESLHEIDTQFQYTRNRLPIKKPESTQNQISLKQNSDNISSIKTEC